MSLPLYTSRKIPTPTSLQSPSIQIFPFPFGYTGPRSYTEYTTYSLLYVVDADSCLVGPFVFYSSVPRVLVPEPSGVHLVFRHLHKEVVTKERPQESYIGLETLRNTDRHLGTQTGTRYTSDLTSTQSV